MPFVRIDALRADQARLDGLSRAVHENELANWSFGDGKAQMLGGEKCWAVKMKVITAAGVQ